MALLFAVRVVLFPLFTFVFLQLEFIVSNSWLYCFFTVRVVLFSLFARVRFFTVRILLCLILGFIFFTVRVVLFPLFAFVFFFFAVRMLFSCALSFWCCLCFLQLYVSSCFTVVVRLCFFAVGFLPSFLIFCCWSPLFFHGYNFLYS